MAINQNHLFEELNGVKCAIVEKNASAERADFLKRLLEYNKFTVIVIPTAVAPAKPAPPAPKPAPNPAASAETNAAASDTPPQGSITPATPAAAVIAAAEEPPPPPPPPSTFTVGVTDVMFNPTNAIFGRLLKTPGGRVVTLAYWQQKDEQSRDDIPYFDKSS
jgi:hypothetical protein